jgi:hypothetical protein
MGPLNSTRAEAALERERDASARAHGGYRTPSKAAQAIGDCIAQKKESASLRRKGWFVGRRSLARIGAMIFLGWWHS